MRIPSPSNNRPVIPVPEDEDLLAKTRQTSTGIEKGCDIFTHLVVTERVVESLACLFRGTPRSRIFDHSSKLTHWLASLHDIGKMTPSFQEKIYASLNKKLRPDSTIHHAFLSQLILRAKGDLFACLAGAHHGSIAKGPPLLNDKDPLLGDASWAERRDALISRLQTTLNLPDLHPELINELPEDLMLGAVILSDWLSSGMDIPHGEMPSKELIHQVVSKTGLSPRSVEKGKTFEDLFIFSPNAVQKIIGEQSNRGNLYIIESEMGSGKTEAALYLAYKLLEKNQANGLYFALPTKLTSEKIVERVEEFLTRAMPQGHHEKALLIHGQSWIDWIPDEINNHQENAEDNSHNNFFLSKKRALLAPFAAGTIDQALLSVVNAKHNALRAFALSGKVVIIDEVHSYDTYTGSLVKALSDSLREWGCTVIILSATLTKEARSNLLGDHNSTNIRSTAYPLLSIKREESIEEYTLPSQASRHIEISHSYEEEDCLKAAILKAYEGQQVLWIDNTIAKAQEIYSKLAASCPPEIETGLIHSRFPLCIRERNEHYWSTLYGKHSGAERHKRGRILVGTQVLEQSIDIDADFLITRLAPSDMLFQRMGRLWRHPGLNAIRPHDATCSAMILHNGKLDDSYPYLHNKKAFLPYELYTIKRTQDVWKNIRKVNLPSDIRPVLEATYCERQEEGDLHKLKQELKRDREILERKAAISRASLSEVQNDDRAETRINDEPVIDVLLLEAHNRGADYRKIIHSPFLDNPIIIPSRESSWKDKKKALRNLSRCMIRVSERKSPDYDGFPLEFLSHLLWTGDNSFRPVRAAFLDSSGRLLNLASKSSSSSFSLIYKNKTGYLTERYNEPY